VKPRKSAVEKWIDDSCNNFIQENNHRKASIINDIELFRVQLHALMPEYFAYYLDDFTKKKWISSEGEFRIPFCGTFIKGKMDAVFSVKGKPWLLESKTSSQINEDQLMSTLSLDLQNNIYLWALERMLHNKGSKKKPVGVLRNIIRRPGIKIKKGESLSQYEKRLRQKIIDDPEHYFIRFEIILDWHHQSMFNATFQEMVQEFMKWCDTNRPSWRYGMPCVNKYGLCQYVGICHDNDFAGFYKREKLFEELKG
jgi:hypothetical protein